MSAPRRMSPAREAVALTALLALLGGVATAMRPVEMHSAPRARNLVVIMIDTLRSDHLASYGYGEETTPFLSRLAGESLQLQGYSASSWTRPSVATFLTGLQPQRHQTIGRTDRLPPSVPFLPEILRQAGFTTAAYTSNANIGAEVGFSRGWEVFREQEGKNQSAARVTDIALEMADQLRSPFFFYVHYIDPHDPYTPRQAWGRPELAREGYVQPQDMLRGKYRIDGPEMGTMRAQYDGEIHEMDAQIARLVRGLDARGLLEDTLLVVTADHGEEFGDHGGVAHGHHLHEEVVRVPFLLHMKRGLHPFRSAAPFHHIDFVPTVLEALGVAPPPRLDGVSRWQRIATRGLTTRHAQVFHLDVDRFGELAVLVPPYKLLYRPAKSETLLYDIAADPREETPLAWGPLEHELLAGLAEQHNLLATQASRRATGDLSEGLRDRLGALGYAVPDPEKEKLEVRVVPPRLELAK